MDIADRAQAAEERDRAIALEEFKHRRLLPAGSLLPPPGICVDCEEPIDPRRLAAHPAAIRCIACQTAFERETARGVE